MLMYGMRFNAVVWYIPTYIRIYVMLSITDPMKYNYCEEK